MAPDAPPQKSWVVYIPLSVAVFLILLPHPSFAIMVASHYLRIRHSPLLFCTHMLAVYSFTFLAFTSLIICVVRDPGPVEPAKPRRSTEAAATRRWRRRMPWRSNQFDRPDHPDQAMTALLQNPGDEGGNHYEEAEEGQGHEEDENSSDDDPLIDMDRLALGGRWCSRCYKPRPERAHHCSACGRCVLKMDHHCPWLGGNCVGYRTYPAFIHFISSATMLAVYITCIALSATIRLVANPFSIDPRASPLHGLFLLLMGAIFSLVMASFLVYHIYLISTNQTTLEHMSPFLLLRYLPPPPSYPQTHVPPPPSSPHARPAAPIFAVTPTPPDSPISPLFPSSPSAHNALATITTRTQDTYAPDSSDAVTSFPPPPPPCPDPSSRAHALRYRPPEEHELTLAQRRLVRHTHGRLRPYDLGWRRNWGEVFGGRVFGGDGDGLGQGRGQSHGWRLGAALGPPRQWGRLMCGARGWGSEWGWWLAGVILCGGSPKGDGRVFERGSGVGAALERLRRGLEDIKRTEGGTGRGWV